MGGALLVVLPVTIGLGVVGVVAMSWGLTGLGLAALLVGLISTMFVIAQGLPRPDVVPRPGEEAEYPAEDP